MQIHCTDDLHCSNKAINTYELQEAGTKADPPPESGSDEVSSWRSLDGAHLSSTGTRTQQLHLSARSLLCFIHREGRDDHWHHNRSVFISTPSKCDSSNSFFFFKTPVTPAVQYVTVR